LVNKTIDILAVYRNEVVASSGATAQLMLPESLKLLPLYVMALGKNIVLRGTADVRPDERAYVMMLVRYLPYGLLMHYIYPRFYALQNLPAEVSGTTNKSNYIIFQR
jgi:protein transport protein SEC24